MEAKLDALETTKLVVTHSWAERVALWGAGGFPEGSVSMRTHSGVIECLGDGGDGGQVGIRLPDLHRGLGLAAGGTENCPEGHFSPRKRREAVGVRPGGMVVIV